jgi:hypothetical protein
MDNETEPESKRIDTATPQNSTVISDSKDTENNSDNKINNKENDKYSKIKNNGNELQNGATVDGEDTAGSRGTEGSGRGTSSDNRSDESGTAAEKELQVQSEQVEIPIEESVFYDPESSNGFTYNGDFTYKKPKVFRTGDGLEIAISEAKEDGRPAIIMVATENGSYVGYMRQADGTWTSKFEVREVEDKALYPKMITEAQALLPENTQWTENKNISHEGLKTWFNQLKHGWRYVQENGSDKKRWVNLSGASNKNELPVEIEDNSEFENLRVNPEEYIR